MKTLLTLTLALFAVTAKAETKTITRVCVQSNQTYEVRYTFDEHGYTFVPATNPPGQPHYYCKVTVLTNGVAICHPFDGQVTEYGCFEDVPCDMVNRAKRSPFAATESKANTETYYTNGMLDNAKAIIVSNTITITANKFYIPDYTQRVMDDIHVNAEMKTNLVNRLVTEGMFCEVIGHVWGATPPVTTLLYQLNPPRTRTCAVCGTTQTQQPGEWK